MEPEFASEDFLFLLSGWWWWWWWWIFLSSQSFAPPFSERFFENWAQEQGNPISKERKIRKVPKHFVQAAAFQTASASKLQIALMLELLHIISVAAPAEPRGEQKYLFVRILGGENFSRSAGERFLSG